MTAAFIAFQSEQRKKASEDYEKTIPDAEILLPTPEENPTINWEAFQDEEFGFEMSYPAGFILKKETLKNGPRLVLEKEDAEGNYGPEFFSGISIIIDVRENENEITLDDFVALDINYLHNSCDSCGNVPQKAQISNINDYTARKFSYYSLGLKFTVIILEHPSEKTFIKIVYSSLNQRCSHSAGTKLIGCSLARERHKDLYRKDLRLTEPTLKAV